MPPPLRSVINVMTLSSPMMTLSSPMHDLDSDGRGIGKTSVEQQPATVNGTRIKNSSCSIAWGSKDYWTEMSKRVEHLCLTAHTVTVLFELFRKTKQVGRCRLGTRHSFSSPHIYHAHLNQHFPDVIQYATLSYTGVPWHQWRKAV